MNIVPLYDAFSEDYDRFVNWPGRLAFEMPFFRALFAREQVKTILDVACGTGQHAIALAREGYQVTATDLSQAMVERARANSTTAQVQVRTLQLGFGDLASALGDTYDALICLGNSLPHVTTEEGLDAALTDFSRVLQPGGFLVVQNRNFDRVLARQERFMSPEVHRSDDKEWIFMRFYDFEGEQLRFNVVRLQRQGDGPWSHRVEQTRLRAWSHKTLVAAMSRCGLEVLDALGSYRGETFNPTESGDLVLVAKRSKLG
jgi:glycine/sarcosine N-methyltransferase